MAHRALDEVVNAAVQEGLELLGVSLYTADLVRAARIGKNRCFSAMSRYEFTPPILAPEWIALHSDPYGAASLSERTSYRKRAAL